MPRLSGYDLDKEMHVQGRIRQLSRIPRRFIRRPFAWASIAGLACAGGLFAAAPAQALPLPPSASVCNYSNATTPANPSAVTGVTGGSKITISCAAGSFSPNSLLAIIEASGLAGIVSPSSAELQEVDLGSLQLVVTKADGSLDTTFTVPTSFAAPDANAACPATQAQVNVGLTCNLVIASLSAAPLDEAMVVYQDQGSPNSPTLQTTFTVNHGVKTLTESDVPGACSIPVTADSHCWWGAAVTGAPNPTAFSGIPNLEALVSKHLMSNSLQVSPAVYCQTGATAAVCAGLPAQTLVPPALSGTVTTSTGLPPVTVDEPNTTPYQGNGTLPVLVPGSSNVEAVQTGLPIHS